MVESESASRPPLDNLRRRDFTALAAGALSALPLMSQQSGSNPGAPMNIGEWSYSWLGVEHATLARGTMCNGMQIYVEHWIPARVRHPYPIVLVHGDMAREANGSARPMAGAGGPHCCWSRVTRYT
jgi:hypothetical protein